MEKGNKIRIIITAVTILLIAALTAATAVTGSRLRTYKAQNRELREQVDSLERYNRQLAEINGISVNVEFELKQTNVLSFTGNSCQNIAREIAQYTRGELLDSLKKEKNR